MPPFSAQDTQGPFNEQLFNILFYHHWQRRIPFPYFWELIKPCSKDTMNHFHLFFLQCLPLMYLNASPFNLSSDDVVNWAGVLFSTLLSKGAEGIRKLKGAVSFGCPYVIPRTPFNARQALFTVWHHCCLQLLFVCFCQPDPQVTHQGARK